MIDANYQNFLDSLCIVLCQYGSLMQCLESLFRTVLALRVWVKSPVLAGNSLTHGVLNSLIAWIDEGALTSTSLDIKAPSGLIVAILTIWWYLHKVVLGSPVPARLHKSFSFLHSLRQFLHLSESEYTTGQLRHLVLPLLLLRLSLCATTQYGWALAIVRGGRLGPLALYIFIHAALLVASILGVLLRLSRICSIFICRSQTELAHGPLLIWNHRVEVSA